MTALTSFRVYFKALLLVVALLAATPMILPANAAVSVFPSVEGLIISPLSTTSQMPVLYGEHNAAETNEVLTAASDLMLSQPGPLQPYQMYSLEILPAHLLLQNYVATVLSPVDAQQVAQAEPETVAQSIFRMLQPVQNAYVSSRFGWRHGRPHQGMDYAAPIGTPIKSVEAGKVVYAGWMNGYGKMIAVDHGNGLVTRYAHLSGIGVKLGQGVNKGSLIGRVGNTGRSTGPHLHFEVIANGVHKNPEQYINQAKTIVHAH